MAIEEFDRHVRACAECFIPSLSGSTGEARLCAAGKLMMGQAITKGLVMDLAVESRDEMIQIARGRISAAKRFVESYQPTESERDVELMRQISAATYEFNRALDVTAIRHDTGTSESCYQCILLNLEAVLAFQGPFPIGDELLEMTNAAAEITNAILLLGDPT